MIRTQYQQYETATMPRIQYNLSIPGAVRDALTASGNSSEAKDVLRRRANANVLAGVTGASKGQVEQMLMAAEYQRDDAKKAGDIEAECDLSKWLIEADMLLARHADGADITERAKQLVNTPPAALRGLTNA